MNATNRLICESWICDTCGLPIENVKDGWVEWLTRLVGDKYVGRGLRLVHHYPLSAAHRCQYNNQRTELTRDGSHINDLPLKDFLGADGLMMLLSFIAEKNIPTPEVLEMIKRLHVPGYEHARLQFKQALAEGVFNPTTSESYYTQSDIGRVLDFIRLQS